jgi:hypothetical protein
MRSGAFREFRRGRRASASRFDPTRRWCNSGDNSIKEFRAFSEEDALNTLLALSDCNLFRASRLTWNCKFNSVAFWRATSFDSLTTRAES